ncbi:glycoside hydrolase [Aspergillus germanicus]
MPFLLRLAAFAALSLSAVEARAVVAHYMLYRLDPSTDHARRDVREALAVGFDGFAMNMGTPGANWSTSAIDQLFAAAKGTNFGLFFSFDTAQHKILADHFAVLEQYRDHPNYMRAGPDNFPMVSSYGGYANTSDWAHFKSTSDIYLIPNLDDTRPGGGDTGPYYTNPAEQLSQYNDIVDGYFSWESAWPQSIHGPENISSAGDQAVMNFARSTGKSYMMGLSALQYKNLFGDSWYRVGEVNLPQRMGQILEMKPEFTEFMTWNDGGESHYIGNMWPEAYANDLPEILLYANTKQWPHYGWQPLVTSFIKAYKADVSASHMEPPKGKQAVGALWYRGMLKTCSEKVPRNIDAAVDSVNYAIVLPKRPDRGLQIRVSSGGRVLSTVRANPGLNYGAVPGMRVGRQVLELLDRHGKVLMSATSPSDVTNSTECNFNFNVVGLEKGRRWH